MKRFLLIFLLGSAGCTTSRFVETDLYFGRSIPDGSQVTAAEWESFVQSHIGQAFPNGFTVMTTSGAWKDTKGVTIYEPSMLVRVIHKADRQLDHRIDSVRHVYQRLFRQESVMRVDLPVKQWKL